MSGWRCVGPCEVDLYYHVVPIRDEKEHVMEGTQCWCKPDVEFVDPDTGAILNFPLVGHHAADCREIVEQAEQLLLLDAR